MRLTSSSTESFEMCLCFYLSALQVEIIYSSYVASGIRFYWKFALSFIPHSSSSLIVLEESVEKYFGVLKQTKDTS